MKALRGQCYCRAVTYQVADDFAYAMNCHCSGYRRATGAALKPMAGIGIDSVKVVSGHDNLMRHGDGTDHDLHCRTCGSFLYSVVQDGTFAHVAMGTLLDTPEIRPTTHIFVGSKADWFEITDDLPQHQEFG